MVIFALIVHEMKFILDINKNVINSLIVQEKIPLWKFQNIIGFYKDGLQDLARLQMLW